MTKDPDSTGVLQSKDLPSVKVYAGPDGKSSGNARKSFLRRIRVEPSAEKLKAFFESVHPHNTAYAVAADIGANAATVEKWLQLKSLPQLKHACRLIDAYGPAVLLAIFPTAPAWLEEANRAEQRRQIQEEITRLEERRSRLEGQKGQDNECGDRDGALLHGVGM